MKIPALVGQVIDWVEWRLQDSGVALGQGTLNAHDEAAWLVLWSLGLPLDADDQTLTEPIRFDQWKAIYRNLDLRINQRLPMAYISGEAWLQGVPFHVDARCIIPRSLIAEVLADGLLDPHVPDQDAHVLDLCTGNGSLAVLCAMAWPHALIDASDISSEALAVAQSNVRRHGFESRIRLMQCDGLQNDQGPYDLIVCNPPYVNAQSMDRLPPEFLHEPALALDGGPDGMDFIGPLMGRVVDHLKPDGALVLEIGHEFNYFVDRYPHLEALWLTTSAGDTQVALITRNSLSGLRT